MGAETRDRIIETSAELFRRQGYVGTGVKQIVAEASAPFGSVYHFFPGGKEQLGAETIRYAGAIYGRLLNEFFPPGVEPLAATVAFFAAAAEMLEATDYADACPIATVALEVSSSSEPLRQACADVFESWVGDAAERFAAYGVRSGDARRVALALIGALEGGFVLARATRSQEPLHAAGAACAQVVRNALP